MNVPSWHAMGHLEVPFCLPSHAESALLTCCRVLKSALFQQRCPFLGLGETQSTANPLQTPSLCLGTTRLRELLSGSCHYLTTATKCNIQPSKATANPVDGKACLSTKGGLLCYTPNTLDLLFSQSFEFLICILLG